MVYSKALILACGAAYVSAAADSYRESGSGGAFTVVTSDNDIADNTVNLTPVTDYLGQGTMLTASTANPGLFLQYVSSATSDSKNGTPSSVGTTDQLAIKIEGIHVAAAIGAKGTSAGMWYKKEATGEVHIPFTDKAGANDQYASNTLTTTLNQSGTVSQSLNNLADEITVVVAPMTTASWYYQCGMKMSWAFMEAPTSTNTAVGVLTDSDNEAAVFVCSCDIQGNVTLLDSNPLENVHFATLNISDCTNSLLNKFITIEFAQGATTKIDVVDANLKLSQVANQFEVKGHPSDKVSNLVSTASGATYKNMVFDINGGTWSQSTTLELYTKAGVAADAYKQDAAVVYMRMLSSPTQLGAAANFDATNSPNFFQDGDSWREIGVGVNSGAMQSMSIFSAFLAVAGSFLI